MGRPLLVCAALVGVLVRFAPGAAAEEVIDRVLAVAVGDVITLSDVKAATVLGLIDPGSAADPVREVLSRLIDRALILDEVDRYVPPEPSTEAVEQAFAAVRARFDSDRAFAKVLALVGLTESGLRRTLREDLRIRAYLDQRFPATAPEGRETLIQGWLAGLRRLADVLDLYGAAAETR